MVHIFDGLLVVQTRLSVVFHLHHDGADVGQADTLLRVLRIKFVIDVVGISVAEQSLGLLFFRKNVRHRLSRQIDRATNSVECQVELIKFFARTLEAQFNSVFLLAILGDLIQSLIQVNDLRGHLLGQSFDAHHTKHD